MDGNVSGNRQEARVVMALTTQAEVSKLLQDVLVGFGLELVVLSTPESFLASLDATHPELLVVDLTLPHALQVLRRLEEPRIQRPLIVLAEPSQRTETFEAKRLGAFAVVHLPLDPDEAGFHLGHALTTLAERFDPCRLGTQERHLEIGNDFSLVTPVALTMVDSALSPLDPRRTSVSLGLVELLTNAIEHGNLGISFEEKREALRGSVFYDLAKERARRSPWRERSVRISCWVEPQAGTVRFRIEDQGEGFDWRHLPDPFHQNNIGARHGRGILMARHAFGQLRYNEKGNVVELELPLRPDLSETEDR